MTVTVPRVAQYARFSSTNQREESLDAQIRAMDKYCKDNKWQVVAVYQDAALSGTNSNRPEFLKMIEDSAKDMFDIVLVHKLDRFSRDRYDSAIYKRKLKNNHVTLCSVLERIDDSPESILMESLIEGMSEFYSKNLARETLKGMNENGHNCKHNGGIPPLGYDLSEDKKLIINTKEAEAVKLIYEMFDSGEGYTEIINTLNESGYRTKKGNLFGKNSLFEILRNEKYTGTYVFNKVAGKDSRGKRNGLRLKDNSEIIRVPGGCPQIISKQLYDRVQYRKLKNKSRAGSYHSKEFYLCSGKIRCGYCNSAMSGNRHCCGRNKTRLVTYRCCNVKNKCSNKEINKDYLDVWVSDIIESKILNKPALKRIIRKLNRYTEEYNRKYDDTVQNLKDELAEVNSSLANINAAIEKGIFNDGILQRSAELEEKRFELSLKLGRQFFWNL